MLQKNKPLTIVVTDSGLGGLSTAADLHHKLKLKKNYENVNLIFFNALADNKMGYNNMKTVEQKVSVFNNALQSMNALYHPDYILIACNTLSVIHEQTEFSQNKTTPVVGIVEASVKLMLEFLRQIPESQIIIFGTETTTQSNTYPKRLIENGISADRIVAEAGSTIHIEIEEEAHGLNTQTLIEKHVRAALTKIKNPKAPIGASLNCTHYGYSENLFREAFAKEGIKLATLINPNTIMSDFLFENENSFPHFSNTEITIKIISQVEISDDKIKSTAKLLAPVSIEVAEALKKYDFNPGLFEWQSLV